MDHLARQVPKEVTTMAIPTSRGSQLQGGGSRLHMHPVLHTLGTVLVIPRNATVLWRQACALREPAGSYVSPGSGALSTRGFLARRSPRRGDDLAKCRQLCS